jgi:hypothetical protein
MWSFMICTAHRILFEINEMDGTCSAYGGEERCVQDFGGETRERDHWGDPGVDGRIVNYL